MNTDPTPIRLNGTCTLNPVELAELAATIKTFLIEQDGCRWSALHDRFFKGENAVDGDTFWAAMITLPYREDDLGDEDCAKPYYYIPKSAR